MNQTQIETQIEIASLCIAELKRERVQLRAWQRNALAVTKRQAEKIKALETERDGLQQKLANCHSEMDKQIREIAELTATIDRMREPLCRAAEQQACNERLMAELAKAPRWVPVGECEACAFESVVVCNAENGYWCEAFRCEEHTWHEAGGDELAFTPTHVLDNLNPPQSVTDEDSRLGV